VLAHAALLAAIIWLFPSPLPRPTQWVLAYFIELAPGAGQGARNGAAAATASAPEPSIATHPPHVSKRTGAPLPKVRLISPRVADSAADSVPDQADAALASVTTAGTGIGRAGDGSAIGDGAGASNSGRGAGERDGDGIEVASADYAHNPLPRYPDYARRHEQQGAVTLRVMVAADGAVRAVEIAESSGFDSLDAAALAAVRDRWRFTPARRATVPVESWVLVPIRFTLKDGHASR
jgi:protein TonB